MLKKYEDERINTILSNLELEMKHDEEYCYRDIDCDMKELCDNIDKVVEYVKNGKQGKLYLNSNIWEICYQALSDILELYELQFIGSDKITEQEEIVKLIDYNNVKDNPDIEKGTTFEFKNYICEVDDYNDDNPNESIVFIYKSNEDFDNGDYIEQVSLSNNNIRENIEDYVKSTYDIVPPKITRLSLLLEIKQQINHNILAYSTNYLMNDPKEDFKNDWYLEKEKLKLIEQMIKEEKEKNINKKKDDIER